MASTNLHKKLTNLDYAILGLLNQQLLTGYGIRMIFEATALGSYSSSPGTIYPAIKRLQGLSLISPKNKPQNSGSSKRWLVNTKSGKKELIAWLIKPIEKIDITKGIDNLLLRFAFMDDLIKREQKVVFIKSIINKTSATIEKQQI